MPIMNMTNHQGISWPSQAKNLPLSCLFALLMMLTSFWTENSLVNSLPSETFLWNGLERSVSTVPGCNKMHIIGSFFLANSTDTVFVTANTSWKEYNSSLEPLFICFCFFWQCGYWYMFAIELTNTTIPNMFNDMS